MMWSIRLQICRHPEGVPLFCPLESFLGPLTHWSSHFICHYPYSHMMSSHTTQPSSGGHWAAGRLLWIPPNKHAQHNSVRATAPHSKPFGPLLPPPSIHACKIVSKICVTLLKRTFDADPCELYCVCSGLYCRDQQPPHVRIRTSPRAPQTARGSKKLLAEISPPTRHFL